MGVIDRLLKKFDKYEAYRLEKFESYLRQFFDMLLEKFGSYLKLFFVALAVVLLFLIILSKYFVRR